MTKADLSLLMVEEVAWMDMVREFTRCLGDDQAS